MMGYFLEMTHKTEERKAKIIKEGGLHTEIMHYYKKMSLPNDVTMIELQKIIRKNNIFMFSIVRHPFDRLVSAYEHVVLRKQTYKASNESNFNKTIADYEPGNGHMKFMNRHSFG